MHFRYPLKATFQISLQLPTPTLVSTTVLPKFPLRKSTCFLVVVQLSSAIRMSNPMYNVVNDTLVYLHVWTRMNVSSIKPSPLNFVHV